MRRSEKGVEGDKKCWPETGNRYGEGGSKGSREQEAGEEREKEEEEVDDMWTEWRGTSVGEKEERETGGEEGEDRETLETDLDARGIPSPYPLVVRLFGSDSDPDPGIGTDPEETVVKGDAEEGGELDCEEDFDEGDTDERRGK